MLDSVASDERGHTMKAIRVEQTGGPEVLKLDDVPIPELSAGSLLVEVWHVGINFIDVFFREGRYPCPLPFVPGGEGVGRIVAVGDGVTGFEVGDRVAWMGLAGSYAELAAVPAATTIRLPDDMTDWTGFLVSQGLTAHFLATDVFSGGEGATALVLSAAGGVGQLLCRILRLRGVRVIGTVSSEGKRDSAQNAGADDVIVTSGGDFAPIVRELTEGAGVDVVFDAVGKPTFAASLASLKKCGLFVLYGNAGGDVEPATLASLLQSESISFIRPRLRNYIETRRKFEARFDELLSWVRAGDLSVEIGERYPLGQACEAHRALQSRASVGKLTLTTAAGARR